MLQLSRCECDNLKTRVKKHPLPALIFFLTIPLISIFKERSTHELSRGKQWYLFIIYISTQSSHPVNILKKRSAQKNRLNKIVEWKWENDIYVNKMKTHVSVSRELFKGNLHLTRLVSLKNVRQIDISKERWTKSEWKRGNDTSE